MKDSSLRTSAGSQSSWLDRQCDQFESAWRKGNSPRIEDLLADATPEMRPALLHELLATELELRRRRGDDVQRDEYAQRFPDQIQLLDELLPSQSRLADPTLPLVDQGTEPQTVSTSVRYADLQFFQRGGLGTLYRAKDEDLHREAVVKFVSDKCLDDPDLLSQFKVEAEITGRLDHPGVAPVYGIGQDWHGRPFYVMRLIRGCELRQAIQEYHLAGGPSIRTRESRQRMLSLLEHLTSASNTVAYAHDVGIVHCDIKPANLMIGKYGETFVLDWGLATSFDRTNTFVVPNEPTMRPRSVPEGTGSSRQRGGTYGYISPEQLSGGQAITPSCDIYSLGATLYEILTGKPPFNGRDPDVAEQIKAGRFPRPREVNRKISCRLEAVCLKAMSHSPDARYHTAKQFAADLQNWMRDDELQASPDRWFDRAARFARRHRGASLASVFTLMAVLIAGMWTHLTIRHAAHEEELRQRVESNFTSALDVFEGLCRPIANGEMSNLGVFRPFEDKITNFSADYLRNFGQTKDVQFHTARVYELRAAVSWISSQDGSAALLDYQSAEDIYKRLFDANPKNRDYEVRLSHNYLSQGSLFLRREDFEKADAVLSDAKDRLKRLFALQPDDVELKRYLAEALHGLGEVYLDRDTGAARHDNLLKAEAFFLEAKKLRKELVDSTEGDERRNYTRDLARSFGYLGDLYLARGNIAQALTDYESSNELREQLSKANPLDPEQRFQYSRGLTNFGFLERGFGGIELLAIKRLNEAELVQTKLAGEFIEVTNFSLELGRIQNLLAEVLLFASDNEPDKADEYRRLSREAAERAEVVFDRLVHGPNSRSSAADRRAVFGLAQSLVLQAALDQIADPNGNSRHARDAEDLLLDGPGGEHNLTREALVTLALARSLQGQPSPAWRTLRKALDRGENTAYRFERYRLHAFKPIADDHKLGQQFDKALADLRQTISDKRTP